MSEELEGAKSSMRDAVGKAMNAKFKKTENTKQGGNSMNGNPLAQLLQQANNNGKLDPSDPQVQQLVQALVSGAQHQGGGTAQATPGAGSGNNPQQAMSPTPQPPQQATGLSHGEVRIVLGKGHDVEKAKELLSHISVVLSDNDVRESAEEEGYDDNLTEQGLNLLRHVTVSDVEPLSDEETLILEMGKLYRQRYDLAMEKSDEKQANRAWGAMQALKKVKEMFEKER